MLSAADRDTKEVLGFFSKQGVDVFLVVPSPNNLLKSYLDARVDIQYFLTSKKIHDFEQQEQGTEHKVFFKGFYVTTSRLVPFNASFYRPRTKAGDPRFWFYELRVFAESNNVLAVTWQDGAFYVFNCSQGSIWKELQAGSGRVGAVLKQPQIGYPVPNEKIIDEKFFYEDLGDSRPETVLRTQKIRKRNLVAANSLKKLYGKCQVSGQKFLFLKRNGEPYLEVHHLVPLGEGGADDPRNMVVVSAHIHRMLHYSRIEALDLSKIRDNKLTFKANGEQLTIEWHPMHAELIKKTSS